MTHYLPLFIGALTVCLFGFLCSLFWAEERTIWASLFGILTAIRFVELVRQMNRLRHAEDD